MQSVIGVFDTREDAESARESLIRAGFDEDDVRVQSHRSVQGGASLGDRTGGEEEGFMAKVGHFFSNLFGGSDDDKDYAGHYAEHVRRGGSVVVVDVADESRLDEARSALASAGAVDIDRRTQAWREEGYSGFDAEAQPYGADEVHAERSRNDLGQRVLPVVQEALEVGKRRVDLGAVRVVSRVETRPVQEQMELRKEKADIQRRSVDRPATGADLRAADSGTMGSSYSTTGSGSDMVSAARTFSDDDSAQHAMSWQERSTNSPAHDDRMAGSSMSPDNDMAYRYGSTLRGDQRYAGRSSWEDVEADARAGWSERNPSSNWERAKSAVRSGWESMTGRR